MNKLLCISDSYPMHPRLKKFGELFNSDDVIYYILWNRTGHINSSNNIFIYNSSTGYGNIMNKIKDFPKFIYFIYKHIGIYKPNKIICRHWQIFFIVCLLRLKDVYIIYDVCDMPNSKTIRFIEKILLKKAHQIVLSSRYFKKFYKHDNVIVLENRPEYRSEYLTIGKNNCTHNMSSKLRVTFLGKIRYFEVMKNLVNALKNSEDIEVKFYGDGPDYQILKNYCIENNIDNTFFFGRYNPEDIPQIYYNTDIVWCAYPSKIFNVKYAISNKFFETLVYKKPGIFSKDTKIAELIFEKEIGFLVDPYDEKSIKELVTRISSNPKIIENVINNIDTFEEPLFWDDYKVKGNFK